MDIKKFVKTCIFTTLAAAAAVGVTSCVEPMFDREGDCEVIHRVRFTYDKNLKWADAFAAEVKSVNLYVFDRNGIFVKEYTGAGEELSRPGYSIRLDLPADDYRFVAWCGLQNMRAEGDSFTVPQPRPGVTTIEELTCALNTQSNAEYAVYSDTELRFLYHGYLEATLEDNGDGSEYEHIIELTKDTNHIRIILQELTSDEDMNPKDYSFCIEAANGLMEYDNAVPAGIATVDYLTWSKVNDEVGVGKIDVTDGTVKYVKGLVADISMARLLASQKEDVYLSIYDERGEKRELLARVPLIQYALMAKKYYESAYGHTMTEQDFLDREDEYVLTFFLQGTRWLNTYIDIHQWRIVIHGYDVQG